jgi:hypothetical protein
LSPPLPILLPATNAPGSGVMQTPASMRGNLANRITPLGHQQPSSDELMEFFQSILNRKVTKTNLLLFYLPFIFCFLFLIR